MKDASMQRVDLTVVLRVGRAATTTAGISFIFSIISSTFAILANFTLSVLRCTASRTTLSKLINTHTHFQRALLCHKKTELHVSIKWWNIHPKKCHDCTKRLYVVSGMFQCISPLDVLRMAEKHVLNQKLLGVIIAQPW